MTLRRLEVMQWSGLLLGAAMWAFAHVFGYGITLAECNRGSAHWGIGNRVWQGSLLGVSAAVIVLAEAAAVGVLMGTRGTKYDADPPPESRIRTLAICAAAANVIFLGVVLLDLSAQLFDVVCRGG